MNEASAYQLLAADKVQQPTRRREYCFGAIHNQLRLVSTSVETLQSAIARRHIVLLYIRLLVV